jgi:RimJ/RimL family protein N-acetyltransferase
MAEMNADPGVMEFMPGLLNRQQSDALIDGIELHFREHGFGLLAAETRTTCEFAGFIGLAVPAFTAHFTPCVEIGWRLASRQWGKGLATEGSLAVLRYGFEILRLSQIVSFTAVPNARSRRVMEKIGLRHDPRDNFDHPRLPEGHPLRRHVLYRLQKGQWEAAREPHSQRPLP